jgi:tetratricopeptide (TPR) repeat protein
MLTQMRQRFDFLVSRKKDVPTRHRTLRAAIDWSYCLLTPELQRFFVRLSAFRGGWTLEAAEAVCEAKLVLDLSAQLQECSLVKATEEAGMMRFRMLESLREYAWDRLRGLGESEYVQGHHLAFFLMLAEEASLQMSGPEQEIWLERLEREHENLRVALDVCLDRKEAETGLRLSAALCRFWTVRGHLREGRERCATLLAMPEAQEHTKARANALSGAGLLALGQGDHSAAQLLYEESRGLQRELGEKRGEAQALNGLGIIAYRQGEYAPALALYTEGLALRREEKDREGIANSLNNLGVLAEDQGDYATAGPLYAESLALRREAGDRRGIANSLSNLGSLAYNRGDYTAAGPLYEESLALSRALSDKAGAAHVLRNLGHIAGDQSAYTVARSLHTESLALERELGNRGGAANALNTLGLLFLQEEDFAGARASLREALGLCRALGDRRIAATTLGVCAQLAQRQRQPEQAAHLYGVEHALRMSSGFTGSSLAQEAYALHQAQLQTLLGKKTYHTAFAAGQNLTFEQALDYVQAAWD